MPAPFTPVPIPFVSGVRQDLGKLAQESPAQLRQAQNVVFTKKGHITGRPGLVSRDAQVQLSSGTALVSGLGVAAAGAIPSGVVATGFQATNKSDIDTPLACWQGQSYFLRDTVWEYAGVHWSLRQTKSVALETHDGGTTLPGSQVPVGQDVVGVLTTVGTSPGVPFLTSSGEVKWVGTAPVNSPSNYNSAARDRTVAAGNAVFWHTNGGANPVFGLIPTVGSPTTTEVTIAAASVAFGGLAATTDGTNYYVAVGVTAAPGTTNIYKVGPTGTVLQTLNVTWAAGAVGNASFHTLDICYSAASNRLGLAGQSSTATATKIITLVGGVMADAAIDLTLTVAQGIEAVVCGVTHNDQMSVLASSSYTDWTTGAPHAFSGSTYIGGRSFTAATETAFTTLNGSQNSFGIGQVFDPLFGGRALAGRTLVGVMHGFEAVNRSNQWVVMDFTSLYASGVTTERTVVACGALSGMEKIFTSSVYSDGTKLAFGVSEGVLFAAGKDQTPSVGSGSMPIVRRTAVRRITLELQGVQATHVNDLTLLSGQLLHVFDGNKIRPHHFPEETPYIFNGGNGFSYVSAGGALAAGSYSYQATWEAVNARGQTTRSGASPILTVTGVALNQQVTLHVSKPQLWNNFSPAEFVRVRLWATQTTPTNNAPKYLAAETVTSTPASGFDVTMVHSSVALGTEEQLYETVDTLADMRAPGADRGIAIVAERAWCADQTRLYASKILRPNLAVAWNTEGPNVLILPATLGTIQGLAEVNEGLVVLCSRGAAVVTGPGVDDTGIGPGWSLQIIDGVPGMGNSSPRSLTPTPAGVVFQAQDGDLWMANSSGQAVPLSRSLRDSALINSSTGVDVVNVLATPSTNSMLVSHGAGGVLRVLDLEMGQWGTWTFPLITPPNGLFLAAINGALWLQTSAPTPVFSVDNASSASDAGLGPFSATIETGVLRQAHPVHHGWGRLRAVVLNELRKSTDTQVSVRVQVYADQNDRVLLDKTRVTGPTDVVAFPGAGDGTLEFRTTVQRCAFFRVLMTITPAIFNAAGLEVWVANTGEKSPTNNRS